MQLVYRLSPSRSVASVSGNGLPVGQYKVSVSASYAPASHVDPPPTAIALPRQVSDPASPGAGTVQNRHASFPVATLYAARNPRIPSSAPETPAITRSPTTSGAIVPPYGCALCTMFASHSIAPFRRLNATTLASSVTKKTRSPWSAAPRFNPLAASPPTPGVRGRE